MILFLTLPAHQVSLHEVQYPEVTAWEERSNLPFHSQPIAWLGMMLPTRIQSNYDLDLGLIQYIELYKTLETTRLWQHVSTACYWYYPHYQFWVSSQKCSRQDGDLGGQSCVRVHSSQCPPAVSLSTPFHLLTSSCDSFRYQKPAVEIKQTQHDFLSLPCEYVEGQGGACM